MIGLDVRNAKISFQLLGFFPRHSVDLDMGAITQTQGEAHRAALAKQGRRLHLHIRARYIGLQDTSRLRSRDAANLGIFT